DSEQRERSRVEVVESLHRERKASLEARSAKYLRECVEAFELADHARPKHHAAYHPAVRRPPAQIVIRGLERSLHKRAARPRHLLDDRERRPPRVDELE